MKNSTKTKKRPDEFAEDVKKKLAKQRGITVVELMRLMDTDKDLERLYEEMVSRKILRYKH